MRSIALIALFLIAAPVFAQEEGGGAAGIGRDETSVFTRIDAVNPMEQVKAFLAKASITLSGDQEKNLKPAVEAAYKQMQETAERMAGEFAARGGRQGGEGRGMGTGRGMGRGMAMNLNNPMMAELRKINDDLVAKINAVLKPEQQATFKKFQTDEIKKARGFAALKLVMEEAGAPLTAEQEPQIQTLYMEDQRIRMQMMREAQGRPDPAKLDELEKITMAKVVKLLTPAQRKALLDSRKKQ